MKVRKQILLTNSIRKNEILENKLNKRDANLYTEKLYHITERYQRRPK